MPLNHMTSRTFVVTGAQVWQGSSAPTAGDLYVVGGRLAPGPADAGVEVVRAEGAHAVPLLVDSAVAQLPPARRDAYDLRPGNAATFAVLRRPVRAGEVRTMLVVDPADLLAVWVAGRLEVWDGRPTRPAGQDVADPVARETWVATWDDPRRDMQQHLRPDGRYTETRGGAHRRVHRELLGPRRPDHVPGRLGLLGVRSAGGRGAPPRRVRPDAARRSGCDHRGAGVTMAARRPSSGGRPPMRREQPPCRSETPAPA